MIDKYSNDELEDGVNVYFNENVVFGKCPKCGGPLLMGHRCHEYAGLDAKNKQKEVMPSERRNPKL